MGTDPVWGELGKVDYLLDQIARAVERGEVDATVYERLAPRYLARRAELVAKIEQRTRQSAPAPASAPVAAPAAVPATAPRAATAPVPQRTPASAPMAPAVAPRVVPWPTVLTFAGAFLVIVAAAIFAGVAWAEFGVGARLGFLGLLTVGFYGWSELTRARLHSRTGAVALAVVSGALLVFDGWIAIDGFHLAGVLPWAVLALVCSLAYWALEIRTSGGVFGAVGAAAQVAWWWLLGQRFDWPALWIAAGLAVVAVAWEEGARRVPEGTPADTLARVLHWAAPIAAMLVVPLGLTGAILRTPHLAEAIAAVVLAAAVAWVLHRVPGLPAGVGAVGSLPLLVVAATVDAGSLGPLGLPLLLGVAAAYTAWELRARGWSYAVLAAWFELLALLRVADTAHLGAAWTQALVTVLAFAWIALAAVLDRPRVRQAGERLAGVASLRVVSEAAGWLALAIASLAAGVPAGDQPPLLGLPTHASHVALAALATASWFGALAMRRRRLLGAFAVAGTLYTAAALLAWLAPSLASGWYALALIALALVWARAGRVGERLTGLPAAPLTWAMRAFTLLAAFVALGGFGPATTWANVAMLSVLGAAWVLEARRGREAFLLAVAPAALVGAAALGARLVWAGAPAAAMGALAAALAALALPAVARVVAPALGSRDRNAVRVWALAGPIAAAVVVLASVADPLASGAIVVGVLAAAFGAAAWASDDPGLAFLPAAVGLWWEFALFDRTGLPGWAALVLLVLYASVLALPSFAPHERMDGRVRALALSLLPVGAVSLVCAFVLSALAWGQAPVHVVWAVSPPIAFALVLAAAGAWVASVSRALRFEPGYYAGAGLAVLGLLAGLDASSVSTLELYTVPVGLYLVGMGYLFAWIGEGRRVPQITDVAGMVVLLGIPALQSMVAPSPEAAAHAWWALALSLVAVAAGVAVRCRAYFFAGVAALVFTAVVRSWDYLVAYWWMVLGAVGVGLLVVALTWERRFAVLDGTRRALVGWR